MPGSPRISASGTGADFSRFGRRGPPVRSISDAANMMNEARKAAMNSHAVGGTLGAFITGIFATASVNANLNTNLKDVVGKSLYIEQLKAIALTLVLAVVATVVIAYILKFTLGLRPTAEQEQQGLDLTDHGEEGYILEVKS